MLISTAIIPPMVPILMAASCACVHKDGIRFTRAGYLKFAHYVEREIRRDLIAARSERNVPLAGDKEEQREINHKKSIGKLAKANPLAGNGKKSSKKRKKSLCAAPVRLPFFGEIIASDRASGLTLLSSITRVNDPTLSGRSPYPASDLAPLLPRPRQGRNPDQQTRPLG